MAKTPAFTDFSHLFKSGASDTNGSLQNLHKQCVGAYSSTPLGDPTSLVQLNEIIADQLFDDLPSTPSPDLIIMIDKIIGQFMGYEPIMFKAPKALADLDLSSLGAQTGARRDLTHQLAHLADFEQRFFIWSSTLTFMIDPLLKLVKPSPSLHSSNWQFTTPLFALHPHGSLFIDKIMAMLSDERLFELRFFRLIHLRIRENLFKHYGQQLCDIEHDPSLRTLTHKRLTAEMEPLEAAKILFARTPLFDLLVAPQPLIIPVEKRFEHTHILAAPGHGKTQLLQQMILNDLSQNLDDVPGMVIIDSHGDMIDKIKRLDLFNLANRSPVHKSLGERLLIIDPSDVEFTPELNLFDIGPVLPSSLSARDREQIMNGIIESFDFIFSGLIGAELTAQQSVTFRHLAELMLSIPGANIHTFSDVLQNPANYLVPINALPASSRDFLTNRFMAKRFDQTRFYIQTRLDMMLQNKAFQRMFGASHNRLDLFSALNEGKIILVDTAKDFLKSDVSSMFGRYMIAQVFKAILERAAIPVNQRRPCFMYIDEASEYFDQSFENLISQARKYKMGIIFANQHLDQLPRNLSNAVLGSTAIKFAAGLSAKDAKTMAPEMKSSPEFIRQFTKHTTGSHFAAFARDLTPTAFSYEVKFGALEDQPRMSASDFENLRAASRFQLTGRTGAQQPATPSPAPPPRPAASPGATPPAPPSPDKDQNQTIPRHVPDEMWDSISSGHWKT